MIFSLLFKIAAFEFCLIKWDSNFESEFLFCIDGFYFLFFILFCYRKTSKYHRNSIIGVQNKAYAITKRNVWLPILHSWNNWTVKIVWNIQLCHRRVESIGYITLSTDYVWWSVEWKRMHGDDMHDSLSTNIVNRNASKICWLARLQKMSHRL